MGAEEVVSVSEAPYGRLRDDHPRDDAWARNDSRRHDIESVDDIRDSLREVREAVDHLSRSRARRRYS
jgi:hypothetical protein